MSPERTDRGQVIAEAAIVLPALLLLSLAMLQVGLLGYAAVVARHAAHRAARAAVVVPAKDRVQAGRLAAILAVAAAPGLVPVGVEIRTRERSRDLPAPMVEARVAVDAPKLMPGFWWSGVRGSCRLPAEPDWGGQKARR